MKLFLDTAGIDDIRTAARWGLLEGVTTNPGLFAKVGGRYDADLREI
jgi:transaldolase